MLRDALDHYNQQKDEVNQDDTLPAAAAKLTLTKRSDKADELLNAFDVASSVGVESIQTSTLIPMGKSSSQIQDHGEDHGDDHVGDQMIGLGVQSSSTPMSTLKSTSPAQEHGNEQQVDHGDDHQDDHVHDGELPKDWHYDDDFFGDAYDAYEDSETDDDNGGVSPETITTTEAGETTPGISEVTDLLRLFNFVQLCLIFVSGI